ncbi:MAG: phage baseplate assembly protein V [Selenomonadaceae bacterium]|nr:phage baseplate assembly protein V [Selenomonadaceae bacterium]
MKNLIREGIVSSVNPENATARVVFHDRDDLVSAELAILQPASAKNQFYSLVDVGDSVVCLMTPNSDDGTGFIIGSRYDDKNSPPAQVQDISCIKFGDGTKISYNRQTHLLEINCVGNIKISGRKIELN